MHYEEKASLAYHRIFFPFVQDKRKHKHRQLFFERVLVCVSYGEVFLSQTAWELVCINPLTP